jgi:hypothetical protein
MQAFSVNAVDVDAIEIAVAKKAIDRLSGDQNGNDAPSYPGAVVLSLSPANEPTVSAGHPRRRRKRASRHPARLRAIPDRTSAGW